MSELLWTPHEHLGQATWRFAQPVPDPRLPRAVHRGPRRRGGAVTLAPPDLRPERTRGTAPDSDGGLLSRAPGGAVHRRRRSAATPARAHPPRSAARAEPGPPAPPAKSALASPPPRAHAGARVRAKSAPTSPPIPEPAPTPAPRPRDFPSVPTDPRGSTPVPYAAARPSVPSVPATEPGRGEAGQAAALAREIAARGDAGPRRPCYVPGTWLGAVVRAAPGPEAGSGPGAGPALVRAPRRAAPGPGSGLIGTRGPDFSEYFRVIEAGSRRLEFRGLGGTTRQ